MNSPLKILNVLLCSFSLSSAIFAGTTDSLKEVLHYDFIISKDRLTCNVEEEGSFSRLSWPQLNDTDAAAQLAHLLKRHLGMSGTFNYVKNDLESCYAIKGWLAEQPDRMKARIFVVREQKIGFDCRISRDEDENGCRQRIEETGTFQVYFGTLPPESAVAPLDKPHLSIQGTKLVWSMPYILPLSEYTTDYRQDRIPMYAEIKPRFADVLANNPDAGTRTYKGEEVAIRTSGDVGDIAVIQNLFINGVADVIYTESNIGTGVRGEDIGVSVKELQGFKAGDRVKKDNGFGKYSFGTVKRVFSNNMLEVKWDRTGLRVVNIFLFEHAE